MSFTFQWPRFSDQFHADAIQMLTSALNKGNKPAVIADKIEVVELEMGTQPPELEIRDIGKLTMDQFRGIFRLTYSGDAHIVLRTKVQANPLNHKQPDIHLMGGSRGMLAAKQPLVVPMLLRLSHFKLNSVVVLVVSRQKGITLVFKTDPLQNVDINSTFDSIAVIQKFIQREIEGQLRQMFREDLPGIIHRLSQQWVKTKVETPYLTRQPVSTQRDRVLRSHPSSDISSLRPRIPSVGLQPSFIRQSFSAPGYGRARTASVVSGSSSGRRTSPSLASPSTTAVPLLTPDSSFPDIEHYDPTYGLRPEGLPTKSVFRGFRRLFAPTKGLADLAEELTEEDGSVDGGNSFDMGNWDDLLSDYEPPPSTAVPEDDTTEYETVPAVGGGTVTRPRVYHSQSQIQPSIDGSSCGEPSSSRLQTPSVRSSMSPLSTSRLHMFDTPRSHGLPYNPYFGGMTPLYTDRHGVGAPSLSSTVDAPWPDDPIDEVIPPVPPLYHSPHRPGSSGSLQSQPSRSSDMTHSITTPPGSDEGVGIQIDRPRRLSLTSSNLDRFQPGSPSDQHYMPDHDPKIVLRPSANSSISKLSTLSHSNHTLSPYTRTPEHFTVRSVPPRDHTASTSSIEKQPVKARRKRIYHLGRKPVKPPEDVSNYPPSPIPASSDFDASEMDRYFRNDDDDFALPRYPDHLAPSSTRRRFPYQTQT